MAILNLLELQPTVLTKDLRSKYLLLYSLPKVGKTSFAAEIPNNLLLAFEKGYNALGGVFAVDIEKWSDAKALLRQLNKDEVKEKFSTITIDTLSIAWDLCEQYICSQKDVNTIGEIPWGQGFALLKKEFSSFLRQITMMGYGLIILNHAKIRMEAGPDDTQIETVSPNIPERAQDVVNALVDLIGYIKVNYDEAGNSERILITRGTPHIVAGTRWQYLSPRIPFGYSELTNAIGQAIDMEAKMKGSSAVDTAERQVIIEKRPFEQTLDEARLLWADKIGDNPIQAERVATLVEQIFGRRMRLSEIPEEKQDLFELLIEEMKNL